MGTATALQRFIRPQLVVADEVLVLRAAEGGRVHRVLQELICVLVGLALADDLVEEHRVRPYLPVLLQGGEQ